MRLHLDGIARAIVNALLPSIIADHLESGRKASNLAFALRVLPRSRRQDALVFYRFCRILDDVADSHELTSAEKANTLDAWEAALATPATLPADLAGVVSRHAIDLQLLREILAGVRADLTIRRYAMFEETREYCWRVASAVGLVSIRVFGCTDPRSKAYAESLGLALQWTNILRDVGEDAASGRIYLPAEDLARFGVAEADLLARNPPPSFLALMHFEAERARSYFDAARDSLPATDRRALVPAEIMRAIYASLLERMASDGFRVFEKQYRMRRAEKSWIAAKTLLRMVIPG